MWRRASLLFQQRRVADILESEAATWRFSNMRAKSDRRKAGEAQHLFLPA